MVTNQHMEILKQFTDVSCDFPVRCFTRFHNDGHNEWVSFWERSRKSYELDSERSDCPREWEQNEVKSCNFVAVEKYIVRRLKALDLELSTETLNKNESRLNPSRYFYTCQPQSIYCHFELGEIDNPVLNNGCKYECYYPQNVIYYHVRNGAYTQSSLTCFNPAKVLINNKPFPRVPEVVTFENIQGFIHYNEILQRRPGGPCDQEFTIAHVGNVAEIYINYLNKSFIEKFMDNESQAKDIFPFIHVKFANLEKTEDLITLTKQVNENRGIRLKFTSFTDGDWRVILRQIANKMGEHFKLLIKQFTDFGQFGHDFGYFARCFVRYQTGSKLKSFWERSRSSEQLDLERDDYEEWGDDRKLKKENHAECYVLRRIEVLRKLKKRSLTDSESSGNEETETDEEETETDEEETETDEDKTFKVNSSTPVCITKECGSVIQYKKARSVSLKYKADNLKQMGGLQTCYNPTSIKLKSDDGGGNIKIDSAASVVTFERTRTDSNDDKTFHVEILLNTSPCPPCLEELKTFADKYEVFIHVKYSSFYKESNRDEFDKINSDPSSNLKITPFTVEDWRVLNRALLDRIGSKVRDDTIKAFKNLKL